MIYEHLESAEWCYESCASIRVYNTHCNCIYCTSVWRSLFFGHLLQRSYGVQQFGSRAGSSTTCPLIQLFDFMVKAMDKPETAGVQLLVYDFSKAFDVLSHKFIIERLQALNFPKGFIAWTQDYLSGRSQGTWIAHIVSSSLPVISGVPQVSVLGPSLYCAVAGSLQNVSNTSLMIKYVDDTTFAIPIEKSGVSCVFMEHSNMIF